MTSDSSEPPPRDILGGYRLVRRLAVGGMAEVYVAEALDGPSRGRLVALKVLLPQHADDDALLRMALEGEARLNRMLSHPNLVRFIELGEASGHRFLVLELVDGVPLGGLLRRLERDGRRISASVALVIASDLLEALDYLHHATDERGTPLDVVHRDVSPQNVLVSRQGDVKLGDLGIARSVLSDVRTRTGLIKGKLRYLSPEQATGSTIDARTDLYAVGLVLWEMLTGRHYLEGEGELDLLRRAEAPRFRPPSSVSDVDPRLDAPLARALARFPEERFAGAEKFREALDRAAPELDREAARRDLADLVAEATLDGSARERFLDASAALPAQMPTAPREAASATRALVRPPGSPSLRRPLGAVAAAAAIGLALIGAVWLVGLRSAPRGIESLTTGPSGHAPIAAASTGELPEEAPAAVDRGGSEARDAPPAAGDRVRGPAAAPADPFESAPAAPRRSSPPRSGTATSLNQGSDGAAADGSERAAALLDGEPDHAPPADVEETRRAVVDRLASLRTGLQRRGVLPEDLDPEQRRSIRLVEEQVRGPRPGDAEETLARLERALPRVVIDERFVRGKLERMDARIRRSRGRGVDTGAVEELAASALQDFMDGRYEPANRRLNRIVRLLDMADAAAP